MPHRLTPLALSALVASLIASEGFADDDMQTVWSPEWKCGSEIPLTKKLLDWVNVSRVSHPDGTLPAFALGRVSGPEDRSVTITDAPLLLFVQEAGAWKAYAIAESHGATNVYKSPDGRVMIFSMWMVEGPGQEYTVVSTDDGFKTLNCGTVPKPEADLGTLDYMHIMRFDRDGGKNAEITGVVEYAETQKTEWFASRSTDGGKTWSVPKKTDKALFFEVPETGGDDELVRNLKSSVH